MNNFEKSSVKIKSDQIQKFISQFSADPGFAEQSFQILLDDTDETTVLQILYNFLDSLSECAEIAYAVQNNPWHPEMLWRICHKISSSAGLLGFKKYANLTKAISYSLKNSTGEVAAEDILLVQQLYRQSCDLKQSISRCIVF